MDRYHYPPDRIQPPRKSEPDPGRMIQRNYRLDGDTVNRIDSLATGHAAPALVRGGE